MDYDSGHVKPGEVSVVVSAERSGVPYQAGSIVGDDVAGDVAVGLAVEFAGLGNEKCEQLLSPSSLRC